MTISNRQLNLNYASWFSLIIGFFIEYFWLPTGEGRWEGMGFFAVMVLFQIMRLLIDLLHIKQKELSDNARKINSYGE